MWVVYYRTWLYGCESIAHCKFDSKKRATAFCKRVDGNMEFNSRCV